jgi:RNA-directed DNA polymerase
MIDMDIHSYFDTINHQLVMSLLDLIKAMLEAGYLEDWRYQASYSGVPQGSTGALRSTQQ